MNGNGLFTIDVTSEIRSLCDAQLRGTWQMPAELVRLAIQCGATEVEVTTGGRRMAVSWRNGSIGLGTLENLTVALDKRTDAGPRQRAIADLETCGAEVLLWAGGVAGAALRVDCDGDAGGLRLDCRDGRAPRMETFGAAKNPGETVIRWTCSKLDRRRALLWLRMACRFAAARVVVDRRPVSRGFVDGLYRLRVDEPLPCEMGLTRHGEEPVLWLMRDGVVAARAVLPGYPPFEAAVELAGIVKGGASSSDLRRAVTPYLAQLSDRAVWMMTRVVERHDRVVGPDGQRLLVVLLRAVQCGLREQEIRSLPIIPTRGGGQLLSLVRLEALARRRGGRLFAIDPDERIEGLLADPGSTVMVSSEVRNLLAELTEIRFQPPPRRETGPLKRVAEDGRRWVRRVVERCRGAVRARIVPAEALSADERRLLGSLRAVLSPRTVDLGEGHRVRRNGTGFVLPRADPAVEAAIRVAGTDPSWLYPLVLSLQLGEPPPGSLRNRWTSLVSRQL